MSLTYVPGMGNDQAKIMIIGEAPSVNEVTEGKPFIGPAGKVLDELLSSAGINRTACWVTNVFKSMIQPNTYGEKKIPAHVRAKNAGVDIDKSISELQYEINQIKPNVILNLGGTALWATRGTYAIQDYRGSILYGMGRKLVSTYHPAFLIHTGAEGEASGYYNRSVMILDMKRAKEESESPELNLPQRTLHICTSSYQLQEFLRRNKHRTRPAVDIEARGHCIPSCIGIAFTPNEGMAIPFWNTGEMEEIAHIPDVEMINIWIALAEFLANADVVGQNFKYDQDKIRCLGFIIRSLASDTMLKSFTINPELPKSLAFNQSILTREPFYKNEGMYEGSYKDLLLGCARDACVTKEVDLKMDPVLDELGQRDWYENFVMPLHDLYLYMESEGFEVDEEKRKELLRKYIRWSEELYHEIFTITGVYLNVNSNGKRGQVYKLLFDVLSMPRRSGVGEEELTALLNNAGRTGVRDPKLRRLIEAILEKRRVDKTIGTYLMAMPDFDGKMKTSYFMCLETGRTRTAQMEPPIRPYIHYRDVDGKKKKKSIGVAFQTMTKHGDIGQDVRSMYIPEREKSA